MCVSRYKGVIEWFTQVVYLKAPIHYREKQVTSINKYAYERLIKSFT